MGPTMELPVGLVALGTAYIAFTAVISIGVSLLLAPVLVIARRKAAFFDDWNDALRAPWLFWHIGGLWYRASELLGNFVLPAPQRVSDLASAHFRSQVVITITELGVPDALQAGPKTAQQLAKELQVNAAYLERVLCAAERMKLVAVSTPKATRSMRRSVSTGAAAPQQQPDASSSTSAGDGAQEEAQQQQPQQQLFHLTQLSAVLCEGHVNSVKHMVLLFGDHYGAFGRLAEGVRTGQTPYKLWSGGLGHWEHMAKQPELQDRFNKAMTNFNNLCPVEAVFQEVSFRRYSRLVDVGGGLGAFSAAALAAAPHLKGHLFDLPNVIAQAKQVWAQERAPLLQRMAFTAGSFFEAGAIPSASSNRDVFVMRQILHDWPDAECVKLLKQVRAALGSFQGARLLIVESCIASNLMTTTHTPRLLGDVHMMVQYGGARERTEAQFGALLSAAGFKLTRITATKSLFFVLEAGPVV